MTPRRLFTASCTALVATAMSFAIRGDIMGDFDRLRGGYRVERIGANTVA